MQNKLRNLTQNYHQDLIKEFNDTLFTDVSLTVGFTENLGVSGSHVGSVRLSIKENDLMILFALANAYHAIGDIIKTKGRFSLLKR